MFDPSTQTQMPTADPQAVDTLLAEMAQAGQGRRVTQLISGSTSKTPRPKMRYTHQAMADLIIENPTIKQNELAVIFDRTPAWVSTIVTCDAFQCLLASRKAELVDPEITLSHRERFNAVVTRSLQVVQEKLAKPADQISDQFVLRTVELASKSLGIGGHAAAPAAPDPAEYLPAVAERLMRLQGRAPQPISDAVVVEG